MDIKGTQWNFGLLQLTLIGSFNILLIIPAYPLAWYFMIFQDPHPQVKIKIYINAIQIQPHDIPCLQTAQGETEVELFF